MARLDDIRHARGANPAAPPADLAALWAATEAATDGYDPLPGGRYPLSVDGGGYAVSRGKGTPSYKLALSVVDGPHAGRKLWHDCYLTPKALPITKRDLGRIGIVRLDQAPPVGIVLDATVALRSTDDGRSWNEIARFEVVPVAVPARGPDVAAFAPPPVASLDLSPRPEDLAPATPAAAVKNKEVETPTPPAPAPVVVLPPTPPTPTPTDRPAWAAGWAAPSPSAPAGPEDPIVAAVAAARVAHPGLTIVARPGLATASTEVTAGRPDGTTRSVTLWSPILAGEARSRVAVMCSGLLTDPSPADRDAALDRAREVAARRQEGGAA